MRRDIPLNFDWQFRPDFREEYRKPDFSGEGFEKVDLPHANKILPYNYFDDKDYQFVSSYRRLLPVPETAPGDRLFLRFEGVMTTAEVVLNGESLAIHEGGYTPFETEITGKLLPGTDNVLFVKVDSREIPDVPPFGNVVDYLCYGGIYREVSLLVRPAVHIRNLFVKTFETPELSDSEMFLDLSARLSAEAEAEYDGRVEILRDGTPIFAEAFSGRFAGTVSFQKTLSGIERWDVGHPVLYDLRLSLSRGGVPLDAAEARFGFRTCRFTPDGFVLNNRPVKLYGLNRHQSWPYVGYAMPKRMQERDAEILKHELGVNYVRTSHYMQSGHFLSRCDELGLLVFEEIPGWQYIGNDHFQDLSCQNLRDMIIDHFNHPSIVLWGVRINESRDDDGFYRRTNDIAHELDDTRQTGGVRNFPGSRLLEDVYTYNDFSHVGDNDGLVPPFRVAKAHVPYLVTENNGHIFPTKKIDSEGQRREHALRHLRVLDAAFSREDVCGESAWCMNDYNTHAEFGSGDRICHHGVMDMFRIPKYAAAVYASQQDETPVLVVASNMAMGDYPKSMIPPVVVFTNCDSVNVYRNGTLVGNYEPDWEEYPGVPHPPVVIDDFYGDQIRDHERWSPRIAERIKKVLVSFQRNQGDLSLSDKLRAANLMAFHKFTFADAEALYGKYVGDWGKGGSTYVFEGCIDDKAVLAVTKGQPRQTILSAAADDPVLVPKDTYEATRILVRLHDEFGNDLPYAADVLDVKTTEELALLGPAKTALIGGSVGVYVRTAGPKGTGTVTISCPGHPDLRVAIEVR